MVVGFLIPITVLVVIIVIAVGVVLSVMGARTGTGEAFSGRLALRGYLRFASLVSSLIITFPTPPGRSVAATLVFIPVWLYELWQVLRIYRRQGTTEGEPQ